jgi:hypothetical protein
MKSVVTIVVIALQLIAGQLLGFGGAMAIGVGNGWELLVFVIGNTVGVWGVGALADRLQGNWNWALAKMRLGTTAVCATLGMGLILMTPPTGFSQVAYPLIGALVGYYVATIVTRSGRLRTSH